jgi:hypothetical protein
MTDSTNNTVTSNTNYLEQAQLVRTSYRSVRATVIKTLANALPAQGNDCITIDDLKHGLAYITTARTLIIKEHGKVYSSPITRIKRKLELELARLETYQYQLEINTLPETIMEYSAFLATGWKLKAGAVLHDGKKVFIYVPNFVSALEKNRANWEINRINAQALVLLRDKTIEALQGASSLGDRVVPDSDERYLLIKKDGSTSIIY